MNKYDEMINLMTQALEKAKELVKEKDEEIGKPFNPKRDTDGFFVDISGECLGSNNFWRKEPFALKAVERYEVFPSEREAKANGLRELAMRKLVKFAKDSNKGWEPDWDNSDQYKYGFDVKNRELECYGYTITSTALPVFKDPESRDKAIAFLSKEEWSAIFFTDIVRVNVF